MNAISPAPHEPSTVLAGDKLAGRVALVTGGTRGIGAAICRSLAGQGASVAALPADPQEWKANAQLQDGIWWEDWTTWIAGQGGPTVAAPRKLGSKDHPPIEAAPGSYVRARP